jgi:transposase
MDTIPLLRAPARIVRDAARAVKGVAGLVIQQVTAGTLTQVLGLPGLVVTEYAIEQHGDGDVLHLFCQHEHAVAVCSRCGRLSVIEHESEERCVRHLDIWGKRTFVHFGARRFDCARCRKPFTEALAWIEGKRRQTRAFELHLYERCQTADQASVAEAEHLHPTTVKDIFYRLAKHAERRHPRERVRWLGIDEISLKKGHQQFALVLSDLQRHRVIAVLPERSQTALEQWLDDLSAEERAEIRVVAMDMWGPYRGVVRGRLSQAKIVADRFHVMKQLNDRMAQIRRALQAKADPATRETLKGTYWILIKNRADLTPDEEAKLQAALSVSAELRTAYLLKEEFHTLCEKLHDRACAERCLRAWAWRAEATGIPQLHKFVQTLHNWWNEFLNYFDERVTSGVVEGLNRAIRAIIRRACGYHVFEHFRLQVLVEHGGLGTSSPPLI